MLLLKLLDINTMLIVYSIFSCTSRPENSLLSFCFPDNYFQIFQCSNNCFHIPIWMLHLLLSFLYLSLLSTICILCFFFFITLLEVKWIMKKLSLLSFNIKENLEICTTCRATDYSKLNNSICHVGKFGENPRNSGHMLPTALFIILKRYVWFVINNNIVGSVVI